jgi:hypothetical protein
MERDKLNIFLKEELDISKRNKFLLLAKGLTKREVAKRVKAHANLSTKLDSVYVMVTNMINGNTYHSDLARQVKILYPQLKFKMPAQKKKT